MVGCCKEPRLTNSPLESFQTLSNGWRQVLSQQSDSSQSHQTLHWIVILDHLYKLVYSSHLHASIDIDAAAVDVVRRKKLTILNKYWVVHLRLYTYLPGSAWEVSLILLALANCIATLSVPSTSMEHVEQIMQSSDYQ